MALISITSPWPSSLSHLDSCWVASGDTLPCSVPPASTSPEYPGALVMSSHQVAAASGEPGSRKGPSDLAGPWRGAVHRKSEHSVRTMSWNKQRGSCGYREDAAGRLSHASPFVPEK